MILSKDQIKKAITTYFAEKPVKRVWLFGSYARDEADEESDIDVLIDFEENCRVGLEYLIWHEDIEKMINRNVDVVSYKGLSEFIKPFIEKDKELIYEK